MEKSVIFLRSTSIVNDSRATKEINTLLKNGYKVKVLGWNRDQFAKDIAVLELKSGIAEIEMYELKTTYGGGIKNSFKFIKFIIWLYKKLRKYRDEYNIIHACDFDTVMPALKIVKKYNKKLVYDIFDYYIHSHRIPNILENTIEKAEIKAINNADVTIICSEARREQISKANPKKLVVIHNTPNVPENIKENNSIIKSNTEHIKVVYVGVLQEDRLLKEVGEKLKKHSDIELHIGGFGGLAEYFKKLSEEYSNIYYYGQMNYKDVLELEKRCDILFATYNPSVKNHKYSAPNKVYEAMALSKPIIVCNDTGVDTIVNNNNLGVSIPYCAEDFIEGVYKLKDKKVRKELGNNARKQYETNYSWDIMERKLIDAYSNI